MNIRLQIASSSGTSFAFEHAGPSVRLGRDPDGELALEGEASQSVSWNHAHIELTPAGAFLTDLNSTNGTLLNDRRISGRTPFRLGDQIQLGHTGPMLKVVELDLSPAPARAPAPAVRSIAAAGPGNDQGSKQPGAATSGMPSAMQRTRR